MGILRSEQMKHGMIVLPVEQSRHFVEVLGTQTLVQFEDMNARTMQRPHKRQIQRISEIDRMVRFLWDELAMQEDLNIITGQGDTFLIQEPIGIDSLEAELKKLTVQFVKFKQNNAELQQQRNAAVQEQHVMQFAAQPFSKDARVHATAIATSVLQDNFTQSASQPLLEFAQPLHLDHDLDCITQSRSECSHEFGVAFGNISGVLLKSDEQRFARMLFRATHGNSWVHFQQILQKLKDPQTGQEVQKTVFAVHFLDIRGGLGQESAMRLKIRKICKLFNADIYETPSNRDVASQRCAFLKKHAQEKDNALAAYEQFIRNEIMFLTMPRCRGGNSTIEDWRLFCQREKAVYATLNLFEGETARSANCWYPASEERRIQDLLSEHSSRQRVTAMLVPDKRVMSRNAPTFIRRNAFTDPFQELVDTYGIPRYGEINPAIFTTVTFPFLFGIMYGDVGHGAMLLCIGVFSIFCEDSIRTVAPVLHRARYLLSMMGFFALYAGLLYNDLFSLGLNLFGSRWKDSEPAFDVDNNGGPGPYPFGIDPAWHGASNELLYINSLKMKISVLFGVAQMLLGLILRFMNAAHEQNAVDFLFECVPMLAFMICFFGYMDYMILYKWVTKMDNPPSIINSLICMSMGQEDKAPLYSGAADTSRFLFKITLLAVPFMLVPKPVILWVKHRQLSAISYHRHQRLEEEDGWCAEVDFDLGEVVIHQIIEVIEFVLGTISHTASYLRLWALSLAHQQLSLVFFQKTILQALLASFPLNVIAVWLATAVWFSITVGVLLGMDVLECFLHTLRLHWVEFQSKFYKGDGFLFEPFQLSSNHMPSVRSEEETKSRAHKEYQELESVELVAVAG